MADLEAWKRVGERVGALIRLRGYKSVEIFAHEHGIDKSVLNRLIRGKREVRLSTFLRITEALDVAIPDLHLPGIGLKEKDPVAEGRGSKAVVGPDSGHHVFLRGDFERIEIRRSARDRDPLVIESNRKGERSLTLRNDSFRLEL